jgi:hypothetical protein
VSLNIYGNLVYLSLKIGNAAYHSETLYEELRRSIPQLANLLLSAEEDKTKANAAGALSNLVRNSNKLCEDIVTNRAMQVCGDAALPFHMLHYACKFQIGSINSI